MTFYTIKLNMEGGQTLELDLNKKEFERMSNVLDKEFPNKDWKTKTLSTIKA